MENNDPEKIMNRRTDDSEDKNFDRTFSKDRFFVMDDGWYYESRLVPPYGPFFTRELAEKNCRDRFSQQLKPDWKFS